MMRKVLVLSYFFPPCNLPAAQRVWGWAKYLRDEGLFPVVVTRNWDHPVRCAEDVIRPGGEKEEVLGDGRYEVHYLPHPGSLRDRLFCRFGGTPFQAVTKPITLLEQVGQHHIGWMTPFRYLHAYCRSYLRRNPDVRDLVVSGGPFVLFKFGALLCREFPDLRWVADYRDEWTTSQLGVPCHWYSPWIHSLETRSERRWLRTAAFVTSVSPYHTRRVSEQVHRPGHTIYNGFDFDHPPSASQDPSTFRVVYNGTLYPSQRVEDLIAVFRSLAARHSDLRFRLMFPGLEFDKGQADRVRRALADRPDLFELTPRIPRPEVLQMQLRAHVLVMLSHPGLRGMASSKVFEYIGLRRPVVVYPNDHDVLCELMADTGAGAVCDDMAELEAYLDQHVTSFRVSGRTEPTGRRDRIEAYSRRAQTRRFASLIVTA